MLKRKAFFIIILCLVLGIMFTACGGGTSTKVTLPRDDAPHSNRTIEWWYYNGHLDTGQGDHYSFHYVVFHALVPGFPQTDVAHLSISDPQANIYSYDQKMIPTSSVLEDNQYFSFNVHGWTMSGYQGNDTLSASTKDYAINLSLEQEKPPVLHQGTGLVSLAKEAKSYYYSRTRMRITGTIGVNSIEVPVTGLGWFDHQWGDFIPLSQAWDWFGLQLNDGTDIMLSVVYDEANQQVYCYSSFVNTDGTTSYFSDDDIEVSSIGDSWTSSVSGAVYPSGWRINIPDKGIDVAVAPAIIQCEFDAKSTTRNYYWEGEVIVSGSHSGTGFVELTGYSKK